MKTLLLKIRLKDKRYCDGCTCLDQYGMIWDYQYICQFYDKELKKDSKRNIIRCKKCIKDNK
jgi:hypothetical protein